MTACWGKKKQQKRERLYREQMGLCHWCKMPMRLVHFPPGNAQPDSYDATFEHLDPRLCPMRGKYGYGTRRVVLAHRLCNELHGVAMERHYQGHQSWKQKQRRVERQLNRRYSGDYQTVWSDKFEVTLEEKLRAAFKNR